MRLDVANEDGSRGRRAHGVGFHGFLLFYPLHYLMARPSWGLGSVVRGIRYRSFRFDVAYLLWRIREVQERRRDVFEQGKEEQARNVHMLPFCCAVSLSTSVLNESLKT